MANNDFLKNLKTAVDGGEFNSEAAKKIIELNNLADEKMKNLVRSGEEITSPLIDKRLEDAGVKILSEEDVALNSEYEKKMEEIKKQDAVNKQLATLIEVEDMVKASIDDMLSFVTELEEKFGKEFEVENPMFGDLSQKIEQIKSKYSTNN